MYAILPDAYYGFGVSEGEDVFDSCMDEQWVRGRLSAHGFPVAAPTGDEEKDGFAIAVRMHDFAVAKKLVPSDSNIGDYSMEELLSMCRALMAEPAKEPAKDGGESEKTPPTDTKESAIPVKYGYIFGGLVLGALVIGALVD